MSKPTVIDLFSGAGGTAKGFLDAGFEIVAAIDSDQYACLTYARNLQKVPHVFKEDLRLFQPRLLRERIRTRQINVIIGGPPCQGFSKAKKINGSNHGRRFIDDPRNVLYKEFVLYVAFFQPEFFIMENVPGLFTAAGGRYKGQIRKDFETLGYNVDSHIYQAADFGVPQFRKRVVFIGNRIGLSRNPAPVRTHCDPEKRYLFPDADCPYRTVGQAIMDLPVLRAGRGEDPMNYDSEREREFRTKYDPGFLDEMKNGSQLLYHHVSRPHNKRDLKIFDMLYEGETARQLCLRIGSTKVIPYRMDVFKDKYKRQSRHRPSSTIVAHLAKDGLMFIHPTQTRSLTPRECARLQSFPDTYVFQGPKIEQYRQIGNAVPPKFAFAIAKALLPYLL